MFSNLLKQSLFLLPFLLPAAQSAATQIACNNSPDLCSRTYDNVTNLGAHDSPYVRDASTNFNTAGNQFYNSTVQLSAGVRLLTAQVHNAANSTSGLTASDLHLCHTSCSLIDAGTLTSWLTDIKGWMDSNPHEVVTILLVNYDNLEGSLLGDAFSASGIESYAYTPSNTSAPYSWPTLNQMISSNKRLVVWVASLVDSTAPSYMLEEFDYIFENTYTWTFPDPFNNTMCVPNRPSSVVSEGSAAITDRMFLMNHFLDSTELFSITVPDVENITTTNSPTGGAGTLLFDIETCTSWYGGKKAPWGVLVDFFNVGPAITSIDQINGVSGSVTGRTQISTDVVSSSSQTNAAAGRESSFFGLAVALAFVLGWVAL